MYKLLLKAYLRDNCIKSPPALATASLSYNFNQKKWQDSLKYVSKRIALPHSSTLILKIMYMQNWNPWKESMRSGDELDFYCKYCRENTKANFKHIFLECPIALQAWTFLNEMTHELFNCKQKLTQTLFSHLASKLILIQKSLLYWIY